MTDRTAQEIDYRSLLKAMSLGEKRRFMRRTNYHAALNLSGHLCLIGLCAFGQYHSAGLLSGLFIVMQGIGMCFLFCAMHEASHNTAFRTKWLNQMVTYGVGFLLFMGPRWFRYFHGSHHRHTQDPLHDPELSTPKPDNLKSYLIHLSGVMIWWGSARALITNAVRPANDSYIPPSGALLIAREARIMLVCYGVVIGGLLYFAPSFLWYFWLLPLLCGQPFLRLFLMAEHADCPYEANMLVNSRTIYTNRFILFLSWQMSYHSAHHSLPVVPFHKLAAFHQAIRAHVGHESHGYSAFHRQMIGGFDKSKDAK